MRIIAGRWRGRTILTPAGRATRPTSDRVREAWMSALQLDLPDSRVLDLFAGSGALGLEALSRGAAHITFVERSAAALRTLRTNIERLGATGQVEVVRSDAIAYAQRLPPHSFDLALADPPYDIGAAAAIAQLFVRSPFAHWLWLEHRVGEALPELADARTRRYGDTALTAIPAADAVGRASSRPSRTGEAQP